MENVTKEQIAKAKAKSGKAVNLQTEIEYLNGVMVRLKLIEDSGERIMIHFKTDAHGGSIAPNDDFLNEVTLRAFSVSKHRIAERINELECAFVSLFAEELTIRQRIATEFLIMEHLHRMFARYGKCETLRNQFRECLRFIKELKGKQNGQR